MTNYVKNALIRSDSLINTAAAVVMNLKKAGSLPSSLFDSGGMGMFGGFNSDTGKQGYASFRGVVYGAVNAIATRGAGQAVHVGRMVDPDKVGEPTGIKKYSRYAKARRKLCPEYMRKQMTMGARTKSAGKELEIIDDHPFYELMEKPNQFQNRWTFTYSFIANLCLTGWSYIVAGEDEEGNLELYSLPTSWVHPDHTNGPYAEFRVFNPRKPELAFEGPPLTRDQVAFAYLPNPADPMSAMAPAGAQKLAIKIDENIQTSQVAFFQNALMPSAIVTMGKQPHPDVPGGIRPRLTGPQRRQVYGAIRKVMQGLSNYGNPAIIDGMIESIERLSSTQNEIGWEKSEKTIKSRILSAFGVHPFILGEEMPGSYAQAFIVKEMFDTKVNVYLDLLSTIMTEFLPKFLPEPAKAKAKKKLEERKKKLLVWWDECVSVDPSMEKAMWDGARGRGDVSQNEYRAYMNLPPDEDKNQAVIDKTALTAIMGIAVQTAGGVLQPDQAIAIFEGLGLPSELARKIAGPGAPQPLGEVDENGDPVEEEEFAWEDEDEPKGFAKAANELELALKALGNIDGVVNKSRALIRLKG